MIDKQMSVQIGTEPVEEQQMLDERKRQDEERKAIQACVAFYHLFNPYNNDVVSTATPAPPLKKERGARAKRGWVIDVQLFFGGTRLRAGWKLDFFLMMSMRSD
jgi:hypothetical protein